MAGELGGGTTGETTPRPRDKGAPSPGLRTASGESSTLGPRVTARHTGLEREAWQEVF